MELKQLSNYLTNAAFQKQLNALNYADPVDQLKRYQQLISDYQTVFSTRDVALFSTPGRTEIIGNHTDHQKGKVIAASVDHDIIALANPNTLITIIAPGFQLRPLNCQNLVINQQDYYTSEGLVKGVLAGFKQAGYQIGGFDCLLDSRVPKGSGMSSSAAFTVLIATILNQLYNQGKINPVKLAQIAQYAENNYFNKPSGLMDQLTCSVGGVVYLDFYQPDQPVIEQLPLNLAQHDYQLVLVNTLSDHADLAADYGLIVQEMQAVAQFFHHDVLADLSFAELLDQLPTLKTQVSDRAILRAIHFLNEQKRVTALRQAINRFDFQSVLTLIEASGNSSFQYLQNVYLATNYQSQPLALALAVSKVSLPQASALRVHGGGFAGTILALIPKNAVTSYKHLINELFGPASFLPVNLRQLGSSCLVA